MVSVRLLTTTQTVDMVGSSDKRLREIANCPLKGQFAFFLFSFEPMLDVPDWVAGLPWLLSPDAELIVGGTAEQWGLVCLRYLTSDADHETSISMMGVYNKLVDYGHTPPADKIPTLDGFYLK